MGTYGPINSVCPNSTSCAFLGSGSGSTGTPPPTCAGIGQSPDVGGICQINLGNGNYGFNVASIAVDSQTQPVFHHRRKCRFRHLQRSVLGFRVQHGLPLPNRRRDACTSPNLRRAEFSLNRNVGSSSDSLARLSKQLLLVGRVGFDCGRNDRLINIHGFQEDRMFGIAKGNRPSLPISSPGLQRDFLLPTFRFGHADWHASEKCGKLFRAPLWIHSKDRRRPGELRNIF